MKKILIILGILIGINLLIMGVCRTFAQENHINLSNISASLAM